MSTLKIKVYPSNDFCRQSTDYLQTDTEVLGVSIRKRDPYVWPTVIVRKSELLEENIGFD